MQDKPKGAGDECATTAADDMAAQRQVLREVLSIYPETMTLEELVRELTFASPEFAQRNRIEQAALDLVAGGLLHRIGDLVRPTRAAVNYWTLEAA